MDDKCSIGRKPEAEEAPKSEPKKRCFKLNGAFLVEDQLQCVLDAGHAGDCEFDPRR